MPADSRERQGRSALDLWTGLLSITTTAAGNVFAACLAEAVTLPLIEREHVMAVGRAVAGAPSKAQAFIVAARAEIRKAG